MKIMNPKNIKFHKIDCCEFENINNIMNNIDVVYHCAATAHEGLSVFSPFEITKNNYLASVSIFTAAVNKKVKRIIFVLQWQDMVIKNLLLLNQ